MPISGFAALITKAAPAASSPSPYVIYTAPAGGAQIAGFVVQNTANIPVTLTIYQSNYNNVLDSRTLTALQAATQIPLNLSLNAGDTILALANQGGVVNVEVDGSVPFTDPTPAYLLGIMLMLAQLGAELPSQQMLQAGAFTL